MKKVLLHGDGVAAPLSMLCPLHEADSSVMEIAIFMLCLLHEADSSVNGDSIFSVLPANR